LKYGGIYSIDFFNFVARARPTKNLCELRTSKY